MRIRFPLLVTVLMAACTAGVSDDRDGTFLTDGKADGDLAEGSALAKGVLKLANEASFELLDGDVGLSARSARNLIAFRAGADRALGTADDRKIDTLATLDGIPYIGPVSLDHLLAYAEDHGYVASDAAAACSTLDAEFEPCLGEHAEGCFDIYADEVQACCYDGASTSQLCEDIREHLDG
jgi:hypothetical protein